MSLAYFPMFPTDFDADTGHLTFAEDGAYNRLLRLSWKCPGAKMPDDLEWIWRRARAVSDEDRALVKAVLAEFFTRTGGKVYSKRLVAEWVKAHEAHSKRVLAGSTGGRAKALKTNKSASSNAVAMPYQPEPEPEVKKEIGKPISRSPDGFDEFWQIVPRKIAKGKAQDAYAKALRKTDARTLIAAMRQYAESRVGQDPQYTAHPASWLNAGRWQDEPDQPNLSPINGGNHGKPTAGTKRLSAFLAGAEIAPSMDFGEDRNPSRPLLARR